LAPCKLQATLLHIVPLCAASLRRVEAVTIAVSRRGYGAGWFAADMISTVYCLRFQRTHGPGLIAVWRVRVSRLHRMIQLQELWCPQPQSRGIVRQGSWHNNSLYNKSLYYNSLYSSQHQALQLALCCNCKSAATCRCLQLHCKEGPYFLVACSLLRCMIQS